MTLRRPLLPLLFVVAATVACASTNRGEPSADRRAESELAASSPAERLGEVRLSSIGPQEFLVLLGAPVGPSDGAEDVAFELAFEEFLRACMAERGFEWIVHVPSVEAFEAMEETAGTQPVWWDASIEEASDAGYGVVVDLEASLLSEIRLEREFEDPNDRVIEQLEPAERAAFLTALYGEPETPNTSCVGQANAIVQPIDASSPPTDLMEQVTARLAADARVVALDNAWSECLAEDGMSFATPDELHEQFDAWLARAAEVASVETLDDGTLSVRVWDPEGLHQLEAEELHLAVHDATCRESLDYHGTRLRVYEDYAHQIASHMNR